MSAFSDSSYSASSHSTDSYSFFDIITALTGAEIIRFRDSETAVFNFAVVSNIETLFSDRVSETTVEGAETSDVSHSCNFSAYDTSVSGFNEVFDIISSKVYDVLDTSSESTSETSESKTVRFKQTDYIKTVRFNDVNIP